ncbi:DUF1828 domain-containing protein [Salmonella enterica]|uniref:DUF1828 domain-containing protein n=6 Tax=Salmonella enterica TaxID=28901 RepID=A0A8F5N2K9_SALDZ|nr:DUF1828 domain-containing protein [Salmonella enterica]EAB7820134.1 DUF1828 domain-containing protein [Salmonella enterica subsp. enterica]EBA5070893.1 DUF1828 domain-containing protein [Salmonella enterica subsp. enterica serovar Poona]EBG5080322.1 DUF1828 domain-containing protein [Salmonella enterica subsp. enterica serovar Adelaide]EBR0111433.1 DUF1828 domain-containing protein [Salmonella enterica subsp. houtenae serovar Houten]EBS1485662.1 DUF1828 domain-containing protein [Salmonella
MMCSTLISQLGFECHPIGETMRIISPFTYCDDGEHVGAFVREINGKYLVSDRSDALMNMESRGISLSKKRLDEIRLLLHKEGAELNERGEIIAWATENTVGAVTSDIIRAGILASVLSVDWHQPVQAEKFESVVIDYLYHTELREMIALRDNVFGMSGHQITVPATIKTNIPKYIFTSSIKQGGSWNSAYSLLGKLIDLKSASDSTNNRYVVVDNEAIGDQMQQLSLLFHESSQVLPFSKRELWVKRLAA